METRNNIFLFVYLFSKHVIHAYCGSALKLNTGDEILNYIQCFPLVLLWQMRDQIITIGPNRLKKNNNCVMNRRLLGHRKGTQLGEIREAYKEEAMH